MTGRPRASTAKRLGIAAGLAGTMLASALAGDALVTTSSIPDNTFVTGYDSQFLPQLEYDTHSTAICCEAGAQCTWRLERGGTTRFRALGEASHILKGPNGTIRSSTADAPTMTQADGGQTYSMWLNLNCGFAPGAMGLKMVPHVQIMRPFKVYVHPQCRRVTACLKWSPYGPCCVQKEECGASEDGCCTPFMCG